MYAWFHGKWGIPLSAYEESMEEALKAAAPVPEWYLAREGERIVGGCGVIENDFHDRPDLRPNVCAVFVEPEHRCLGIAGQLLAFVCRDFHDRGIDISDGRRGLACMHEDPLFRLAAPRMSVARFPVEEISAHAVRLLLRQIRESQSPGSVRPAPESVVLPCRMEFRDE